MRILVLGAGLSGCTAARLLKDEGYSVALIEKESHIGGLCLTRVNDDGVKYEPFGARTFHTAHAVIRDFITRFDDFNGYTHRKGMILNDRLSPFPITRAAIDRLPERDRILSELSSRPAAVDRANFETATVSIFGRTLYQYFIENYTAKMWGCPPCALTADWAPKRLEFREDCDDALFKNQWQGLPVHGYTYLLERMIADIPVTLSTTAVEPQAWDLVLTSAPIDRFLNYEHGRLEYRSLTFDYVTGEAWEKDDYGTINLPQHARYIRKCNFNILHRQNGAPAFIQYQEPVSVDDVHVPMYPVNTPKNQALFGKYLRQICRTNMMPIGRLGLFRYLDMDKAVEHVLDMLPLVRDYLGLQPQERVRQIEKLLENY
jgi:UDP-galactopyranose mutase